MGNTPSQDSNRPGTHMISADDAEYPREYRTLGNGTRRFSNVGLVHTSERRHTVIAAQSLEALTGLQKSDMERKRDAFMDHLKNKYPQHALAIRGQQERIRDQLFQGSGPLMLAGTRGSPDDLLFRELAESGGQDNPPSQANYWSFKTRSTRHSQGSQPGLADQAAKLSFASAESLETMSEADLPLGFNRMNRFRQSLPLSRSTSQTKLRSPGVLFLQFGDESRRVHITHEISSMDTLHALIVHMFPQKLTMGMLKSPNTAILIKDESRNVFYELEDVRDIQDRSIIKIFRKEPLYASFPGTHMTNGDLRRDMVYSARDSSPTRRLNNMSPASHLTSGSPPPVLQSSSPARSRMSYSGGRPPSFAGSPVHHAERHSNLPPAQGVSPSPSAILERRDVKPDEDLANKNVVLVKNEGLYADPYGMVHEGRLSISSTQSLAGMGDPFSYPGGLYKRGSVRSLSTYSAAALQSELEDTLYKTNSQIYSDPYGPGMGFRMPPSSPQKMTDGRLVDVQQGQSPHSTYSGPSSRSSPVRQSFRKDSSSSVFMDSPVNKTRNSSSSGPPEAFPGPGERSLSGFSSPVPTKEVETRERMEAMEKQIASLTGLVQSALFRGPEGENPSEKTEPANGVAPTTGSVSHSNRNSMATLDSTPAQATTGPMNQQTAINRLHMQLHLHGLQQNTSELRNQLQQLKKMQLQNQETVKTMLKRTETEISVRVTDTMRKQEDPLQRQRALVEEERLKYLNEEELITQQLSDLEKSVEKIKKDLSHSHQLISVQELEEKTMVLQQLGQTLTELKAHFPSLQSKMRVILRVEVEAVKFLKEEPQRLDTLMKRCKSITDTLVQIRRQVEEGVWHPADNLHNQSPKQVIAESEFTKASDFEFPTSPPMNFNELTSSQTPTWESMGHGPGYNQSSSCSQTNTQRSHNPSRAGEMVAVKTQTGPEVPTKRMSADKSVSVEAAERDWEEKRAALTQYSAKDINRLLEETQAELMKAIPDLDFAAKHKQSSSTTSTPEHKPTKPQHMIKGTTKIDPNGRRGSEELTVPRYRTEKPSKSPPPPPPRRSFPSSHGITTARTGEVIVTGKKETTYIKKADSEELESQKPQVKLRRTVSEVARPASTPPIIASGIKDDDDEDRIIAELEVFQRSSGSQFIPQFHCDRLADATSPTPVDMWPHEAAIAHKGWKGWESPRSPQRRMLCLPQIVLSEWVSDQLSPTETQPGLAQPLGSLEPRETADKQDLHEEGPARPHSRVMLENDSFQKNEHSSQLEMCSTKTGIYEKGQILNENPQQPFMSSSSKEASIEGQSLSLIQYLEASELNIDDGSIQRKHCGSVEETIGFLITKSMIQALSRKEVDELSKSKGESIHTVKIDTILGQECAEIRSQDPFLRLDNKSVLVIFSEPLELGASYKMLLSVFEEVQDYRGFLGIQREGEVPPHDTKKVGLMGNRSTCTDADGGYLKPTRGEHLGGPVGISGPKQPVPKPRTFQGKDPKLHVSKPCRIQVPKSLFIALSQAIQSGAITTKKMLKVLAEQEEMKMHINELNISEEAVSEPVTDASLCTVAQSGEIGNTYQRLDSLEDTIRALELTLSQISDYHSSDLLCSPKHQGLNPMVTRTSAEDVSRGLKSWNVSEDGRVTVEPPSLDGSGKVDELKTLTSMKAKPPLMPKPNISAPQSGGVSIPAMKMVNPAASRLKVAQQQGSPDKSKHIKQRMEYMRIQGQQQAAKSPKEASGVNETSNPGSEKTSPGRTAIPVLTSFGTRNSSISF
ncbi:SRC kinase signaling inhibitor 1 isoform X4 [Ambystoma mexicanum]|uniref:SRC kinase signaling inhibitor 1 isoform X4 n=1 Tax=Ambystoma mexicanum TaxID=8296 RepID=UPI0037E8261C